MVAEVEERETKQRCWWEVGAGAPGKSSARGVRDYAAKRPIHRHPRGQEVLENLVNEGRGKVGKANVRGEGAEGREEGGRKAWPVLLLVDGTLPREFVINVCVCLNVHLCGPRMHSTHLSFLRD